MAVPRRGTQPWRLSDANAGHVRDADHKAVAIGDRRLCQITDGLRQRICPNDQAFASALDDARTGLDVGAFQRLNQLAQADAVAASRSAFGRTAYSLT